VLRFVASKPKLRKLLEFTSIGGELDTIWWKYNASGITQIQVDSSHTVAVLAVIRKSYFTEYKADEEGEVKIPLSLYNVLDKYFKEIEAIEFVAGNGTLTLHSKNESYESALLQTEVPMAEISIEEKEYGLVPTLKVKITGIYGIDSEEWNIKADKIRIEYGDMLKLSVSLEDGGTYTRTAKILDKRDVSGSGSVLFDGKMFKSIIEQFSGPLYLILSEGPVILSQKTSEYSISYVLAPLTSE